MCAVVIGYSYRREHLPIACQQCIRRESVATLRGNPYKSEAAALQPHLTPQSSRWERLRCKGWSNLWSSDTKPLLLVLWIFCILIKEGGKNAFNTICCFIGIIGEGEGFQVKWQHNCKIRQMTISWFNSFAHFSTSSVFNVIVIK